MRNEKPLDARCSSVRVRAYWLFAVAAVAVAAAVAPAVTAARSSTARAPIASSTLVSGVNSTPGATAASNTPSATPSCLRHAESGHSCCDEHGAAPRPPIKFEQQKNNHSPVLPDRPPL